MSAGAFTSAVLVLYAMVGVVCCVAARSAAARSRSWGDGAFAFALWPLWLPLWLGAQKAAAALPGATASAAEAHPATASLLAALARVQGSPLAPLLPDQAAVRGLAAKLTDVS